MLASALIDECIKEWKRQRLSKRIVCKKEKVNKWDMTSSRAGRSTDPPSYCLNVLENWQAAAFIGGGSWEDNSAPSRAER